MIDEKKLIEEFRKSHISFNGTPMEESDMMISYRSLVRVINEQPKVGEWIPVSERLPEERDWYLAIFKEYDEEFMLVPRVADYVGHITTATTDEGWLIIDLDEKMHIDYYKKLKCIAWMPLPPAYRKDVE